MKAKLKLITAISHKAKLLILDESTAGLDVMARNEMLDMLRDYMEEDTEWLCDSKGWWRTVKDIRSTIFNKNKKESYGYACLTDQKQFYLENYPKIVIEKG